MKAWYLEVKDSDQGSFIVFADSRNEARSQAGSVDLVYDKWTDIRATRAKKWDGNQDLPERELNLRLWRDGWEWLEYDSPTPEETSDEEFYRWYEHAFGGSVR